ncbi:LIM domain-containing protein [Corynebacterium uterequi]|uniref:ATP/GTP-binding protein n=1 Tax=Corynebacterium uterequi TaxID=1072256 RepID=A0A0G3HC79_9CORY|nr:hypothetical protein [Corynebacterium uterequi]AKK10904.1 hypothetical protein CUTER_04495 [Corynebacterium uterequi]
MGRKNRRQRPELRQLPADGSSFYGTQRDGDLLYRHMGSARAVKYYVCPGCNQNIPPGIAHIVAWEDGRADFRRHWHRACFERRR